MANESVPVSRAPTRASAKPHFPTGRPGRILAAFLTIIVIFGVGGAVWVWMHYSHLVDEKLKEGPFAQTAEIFAAPEPISTGETLDADELTEMLRRSGYTDNRANRLGWYKVRPDGVEIFPGVDAWPESEPGVIFVQNGVVTRIVSTRDNSERTIYLLEPALISNLFDRQRQKRRVVHYNDIPRVLVDAVTSAEDKRFFQHAGFDPLRIIKAMFEDVREGRKAQGASTLSMQLARNFWLGPEKTWRRKVAEALITMQIEQKLTKQQIFEYYANQVDLGQRRSFAVRGFGEAAQVYFGKDVRELRVEEAALLAGMIQKPNLYNPYRHEDRALQRRNVVLGLMHDNGYLTDLQYVEATQAPLKLAEGGIESTDAPYFVDLVNDELRERFSDVDFQTTQYRIYTTLDMKLQREAVEAVRIGIKEVDDQLAKRRKKYPEAQVALVAMDPHTGEVRALLGGRNYGLSQLNRALAERQPGSSFKPFVYAAALRTAIGGGGTILTPVSQVIDEPTTFVFDDKIYEPNNFHEEWHGRVTLRDALAHSMNIPTVKFAEEVGYETVAELARDAGLENTRGTPAEALGAYEATPLQIASAYTTFSNGGTWVEQNAISEVRDQTGKLVWHHTAVTREVLDPRVAYMVTNLMEEVLRSGTGANARTRGFLLPAAGKTGTSRDAWFVGFTTRLLCAVWVGFDDNTEMPLEGAKAALPIWTEFMKRAHSYREYKNVAEFEAPDGVVSAEIDPLSGQLATSACPQRRAEVFIAGTQPTDYCRLHGGSGRTLIAGWDTPEPAEPAADKAAADPGRPKAARRSEAQKAAPNPPAPSAEPKQKKGFWDRIRAIFR
jgi:penicillin-binding protein 1B